MAVTADRADYEPGDRVTLDVRTTDASGKPVAAEVALAAVDERLFALAGDRLEGVAAALTGARGPERFQRKSWRHSPGVRKDEGKRAQQMQKQQKPARSWYDYLFGSGWGSTGSKG